ncbi:MAG: isoprenoid biosynthesis glyoxalase ElbB [Ignavibacteria bacterium]|nr:isoprenoid biosynthesis glyoxalase ElbB [Ignavibacteria bacterium]
MEKSAKPLIGVLLSGCGVYDGSEIHEATLTLLELQRMHTTVMCIAPNINQYHVVNHLDGSETHETRNVLVESARIARGSIVDVASVDVNTIDALVIPGGFGAAKNLTSWAFDGPDSTIQHDVGKLILDMVRAGKPVAAFCMGPVVVAKALEHSDIHPHLTVGTTEEASPYDIGAIHQAMEQIGAHTHLNSIREITVDASNNIVSAPCYMMEATIEEVHDNIKSAVHALLTMLEPETVDA